LTWAQLLSKNDNFMASLEETLGTFQSVSLSEMNKVKLMKRTETKYVFDAGRLPEVLGDLAGMYRVLEIDGVRMSPYKTIYFDTEDLKFYTEHHNGKLNRQKVRIRTYVNSASSFIEVKTKNNKGRMVKKRVKTEDSTSTLSENAMEFISKHVDVDANAISVSLWNGYKRITLVDLVSEERVTIDLDLEFDSNGKKAQIQEVIIAEVKQKKYNVNSAFIQRMRNLRIRPMRMSKYCIGSVLLKDWIKSNQFKDGLKYNRFKAKITTVNNIEHGRTSS